MSRETNMTSNAPAPRRMKRKSLYIAATALCILAYAGLIVLSGGMPVLIWPAIGVSLLSMVFSCLWMATLDEAAQQAHYIAWFWGGSAGLAVSMMLFVAVALRPAAFEPVLAALGVPYGFAAGIACGLLPPVIGYAIWWAALWLRRR